MEEESSKQRDDGGAMRCIPTVSLADLLFAMRRRQRFKAKGHTLIVRFNLEPHSIGSQMAKPNYAFAKRQRDLAKKQKKKEKRQRKTGTHGEQPQEAPPQPPVDETTVV
ncbi:MAG: hypothetical protein M3495_18885 [Pseudomonadota bacterium]|nr:hypothetical protein [Gammaproteobacteria bacterium]MDQ3583536.1 hypothetical protein [Pseudomonadota bacterium]